NLNIPEHELRHEFVPEQVDPGKCYVFHLPASIENPSSLLVHRLRRENVELLRYPKTPDDFTYVLIGGPLFRIDFRFEGKSGTIFDLQGRHPDLLPPDKWHPDDYILSLASLQR